MLCADCDKRTRTFCPFSIDCCCCCTTTNPMTIKFNYFRPVFFARFLLLQNIIFEYFFPQSIFSFCGYWWILHCYPLAFSHFHDYCWPYFVVSLLNIVFFYETRVNCLLNERSKKKLQTKSNANWLMAYNKPWCFCKIQFTGCVLHATHGDRK